MKPGAKFCLIPATAGFLCVTLIALAEPVIDSFSQNGKITWQVSETTGVCDVEWASSADGPWYQTWGHLKGIAATSASMNASVPMFFRVVHTAGLDQGLLFWMPCNGDLLDHSAYGNNPTTNGPVDLFSDRAGNPSRALRLDTGEFLTVPGSPSLVVTNVTIALWAKFSAFVLSAYPGVIEMGPHDSVWSLFMLDQNGLSVGPPKMWVRGGSGAVAFNAGQDVQTNRWYHLAATINGTQAILYVDGAPARTGTVAAVGTTIGTMYVGCAAPGSLFFSGSMDDIRIYNRPLGASDIAQIYSLAP